MIALDKRRFPVGFGVERWAWAALAAVGGAGLIGGPRPVAAEQPPPKIAEPVELGGADLLTKDGVQLRATFYPGNRGKDTVPVILLHMQKGDRRDFASLVPFLQQQGHAVLAPDLRGHGDSTRTLAGVTLDGSKSSPALFAGMVQYDMETLKAFLMKKNNAGELNIERLCVVGAEMGASVAIEWAKQDWSWPIYPGLKQGQDVKTLILISPKVTVPGLNVMNSAKAIGPLSIFLVVGKGGSPFSADARQLDRVFQRFHPDLPKDMPEDEAREKKAYYFIELDTKLQGTKLLNVRGQALENWIVSFIYYRAVNQPFPWADRGKK